MNVVFSTKLAEKLLYFFCFGCATQNKALGTIKLISKFFFHEKIYGVNFKRLDNGPNSTTVSTIAAREIFKQI